MQEEFLKLFAIKPSFELKKESRIVVIEFENYTLHVFAFLYTNLYLIEAVKQTCFIRMVIDITQGMVTYTKCQL